MKSRDNMATTLINWRVNVWHLIEAHPETADQYAS